MSVPGLNESVPKSGVSVLKYYSDRFKTEPYLISHKSTDPDEDNPVEMLLFVRKFTWTCMLRFLNIYSTTHKLNGV